jgi:hypothetical protein
MSAGQQLLKYTGIGRAVRDSGLAPSRRAVRLPFSHLLLVARPQLTYCSAPLLAADVRLKSSQDGGDAPDGEDGQLVSR